MTHKSVTKHSLVRVSFQKRMHVSFCVCAIESKVRVGQGRREENGAQSVMSVKKGNLVA